MRGNRLAPTISVRMSARRGRQKFRSSVTAVKTALRFLLNSDGKPIESSNPKRKRGARSVQFASLAVVSGVPDAPSNVRLMVTGADHITVTFDEPLRSNGVLVIKYKSKSRACVELAVRIDLRLVQSSGVPMNSSRIRRSTSSRIVSCGNMSFAICPWDNAVTFACRLAT